jgi:sortase A
MKRFPCRRSFLILLAIVLFVGTATIALTPGRSQADSSVPQLLVPRSSIVRVPVALRAIEPTLVTVAARPPTAPPAPAVAPPLPVPAAMPNPANRVALTPIGRIQIPKIGVDQTVREGIEQMVIDAGPAHWPGTAAFGSWGNVVLAGHRTTHTEPFLRAAELAPGDPIILSDGVGTYTYQVTLVEVVSNTKLSIVDQHPGRTLTIFTCHPIGSSAQRLVVNATLMSAPAPGQ